MDLETGRKMAPPEFLTADEIANGPSFRRNERFARWCQDQGIDLLSNVSRQRGARPAGGAAKDADAGPELRFALIGLDMVEARILPQSFGELTVEDAREILDRQPGNPSGTAWMSIDAHLVERPDTFAFKTRGGDVGLLQLEAAANETGKLTIRYRLERRD